MILAKIIETLSHDEMHECFLKCYPAADVTAHLKVFDELRSLQPVDDETTKIHIEVKPGEYAAVYGITPGDDKRWAIQFERWENWLGMEIEESTRKRLSPVEIVAHCLWEMTFEGFEQEKIQATMQAMVDTWDEFKQSLDADEDH